MMWHEMVAMVRVVMVPLVLIADEMLAVCGAERDGGGASRDGADGVSEATGGGGQCDASAERGDSDEQDGALTCVKARGAGREAHR